MLTCNLSLMNLFCSLMSTKNKIKRQFFLALRKAITNSAIFLQGTGGNGASKFFNHLL